MKMIKIPIKVYRLLFVVWLVVVIVLLVMPQSSFEHKPSFFNFLNFPNADKLVHSCMFALLGFLLFNSLKIEYSLKRKSITTIVALSILGFLTECLQGITYTWNHRSFSIYDWLFDTAAVIMVVLVIVLYRLLTNSSDS